MIDKDFCLSSYIGLRYIYDDNYDFFNNMKHRFYTLKEDEEKKKVSSAKEIDEVIQDCINNIYAKYKKIGILLSGGMDSAILCSYLKPNSIAYTFSNKETDIYNLDIERAEKYCKKFGITHKLINIDFEDYKKYTPIVMKTKGAPTHSIEPQIYKAAQKAQEDGIELMIIGDAADYVFGGMDKLLSKEWKYEDFIKRYISLDPQLVLSNPKSIEGVFLPYKKNNNMFDLLPFMSGPISKESYGSYENAFFAANMKYFDPYEIMVMKDNIDLERIRNGESKYLIRELYRIKYPEFEVPEKIPMPRPVDKIFKEWKGPTRLEFNKNIPMNSLTGNQKWQLWCAEQFLELFDK